MQLSQYQEGHINWFYTKNNSLTIIGGHLGFWQLWWYAIFFRIFHPFCHPQKHMYRGKFCISLIIRSWDKKISMFFGGGWGVGGCSLFFHEGQLFVIYLFKSEKAFRMSTLFECRYLEDNFLVQSGDFCIHDYKIRFCKEVYIPPTQNRYFQKSCAIGEVAVRPNMMADLSILNFRNSWHNSFLEKHRLHHFTAFCACSSSITLDMCIR